MAGNEQKISGDTIEQSPLRSRKRKFPYRSSEEGRLRSVLNLRIQYVLRSAWSAAHWRNKSFFMKKFLNGMYCKSTFSKPKIRFNTSIIASMPQKATIRFVLKDPCTPTESEWLSVKKYPWLSPNYTIKQMCRTRQKYSTRKKRFLMGLYYKSTFSIEKSRFNTSIVASKRQK